MNNPSIVNAMMLELENQQLKRQTTKEDIATSRQQRESMKVQDFARAAGVVQDSRRLDQEDTKIGLSAAELSQRGALESRRLGLAQKELGMEFGIREKQLQENSRQFDMEASLRRDTFNRESESQDILDFKNMQDIRSQELDFTMQELKSQLESGQIKGDIARLGKVQALEDLALDVKSGELNITRDKYQWDIVNRHVNGMIEAIQKGDNILASSLYMSLGQQLDTFGSSLDTFPGLEQPPTVDTLDQLLNIRNRAISNIELSQEIEIERSKRGGEANTLDVLLKHARLQNMSAEAVQSRVQEFKTNFYQGLGLAYDSKGRLMTGDEAGTTFTSDKYGQVALDTIGGIEASFDVLAKNYPGIDPMKLAAEYAGEWSKHKEFGFVPRDPIFAAGSTDIEDDIKFVTKNKEAFATLYAKRMGVAPVLESKTDVLRAYNELRLDLFNNYIQNKYLGE